MVGRVFFSEMVCTCLIHLTKLACALVGEACMVSHHFFACAVCIKSYRPRTSAVSLKLEMSSTCKHSPRFLKASQRPPRDRRPGFLADLQAVVVVSQDSA